MKLSEFRFDLPQSLIALNPTENREDARMMVVNRKEKTIEHKNGVNSLQFNQSNLASGIYLFNLIYEGKTYTQRLVIE